MALDFGLGKVVTKAAAKSFAKEALPVIGKEVAEQTFKTIDVSAKEALGNLGRHKTYKNLAIQSKQAISNHLEKLPSNAIQPEAKAIDSIFQKIEGSDLELQNVGWRELDDTVHALGAVDEAGHKAIQNQAKMDEVRGKSPLPEPAKTIQPEPIVHRPVDLQAKQNLEQVELANWLDQNEQALLDGRIDLQKGFGPIIYNNKAYRVSTSGVKKYFAGDAGARDVKHLKIRQIKPKDATRNLQKDAGNIDVSNRWLEMANQAWKSGAKITDRWGKTTRAGVNPKWLNPDIFRNSLVRASGYLAEINTKLRRLDPAFEDLQVEHSLSLSKAQGTDDVIGKHFGSGPQNVALNRAEIPKGSAFNQESADILGMPGHGNPEKAAEFTGTGASSIQRAEEYKQFGWLQAVVNRAMEAMETKGEGLKEALKILKAERDALAKGELRGIKLRIPGTKVTMTDMLLIQQRALNTGNYAEAAESVIAEREVLDLAIERGLLESPNAIKVLKKYIKWIDHKMEINNAMRAIEKGKAEKWTKVQKPVEKYDVRKLPPEPAKRVDWSGV